MKQRFTIVALFFSILNATDTFGQEQIGQKAIKSGIWNGKIVKYVDREVAVKARRGVSISEFQAVLSEFKGTLKQDFNLLRWAWIDLPEGGYTLSIIDQLKKLPVVETAEPNFIGKTDLEPNDPYFKGTSPATYTHQWSLKNTGQVPPSGTIDADIDGPEAWSITTGNQDVIIAVLDSGIPMENGTVSHPDLDDPAKIILGPDYIDEPGSPEYQEGVRDRFGHGTHVAGIAGAETNNGEGIAGVAWNCKLMIIQVTDGNGNSTVQTVQNGISHAVDYYRNNPAKRVVVNLSLSFPNASQALLDAIDYANMYNVLVVASAGNNGWTPVNFPAGYSGIYSNVIAVGASDHQDNHSSFASQGPELNVVAPGGFGGYQDGSVFRYNGTQNLGRNIFSTTPDYPFNLQSETDLEPLYTYSAGVSMAVPHVSGTTALLLSLNPSLSPSDIRTILEATAEKVGGSAYDANGWNQEMGYGRINAYKALKLTLEQHGGTLTNNLTIPAGEVWNFSPGVIVRFAPGTGITVLGTLNAVGTPTSPVLFTSASGSTPGSWGSIVFDGSGASGSTLQYATIQYNTEIHAVNTSNITIQNCSVLETDQGIRFTTATGSVLNTSLTSSTVYHGIVAENGSTITCNENILNKVSPNLRTGAAILYVGSGGNLWKNDVYGWDWGVGTIWGSSPHFYNQSNNNKNNRIRNCNYGVMVYRQSYPVICPDLAENFPPYMGNSIYSNTKQVSLNADNNTTSALPAQLTWWGGEPTPSMFVTGTGSSVDYDNWLDTDPWEGSGFVSGGDGESVATTRATVEQSPRASQEDGISLHDGIALRQQGKLREATDFFLTYLAGHPDHQAAYVELYNCYNEETATDLINYFYFSSLPAQAAKEHALLLGNLHLKSGNPKLATKINEKLINENPNSALSSRAKLNNAYIALYNEKDIDRALVLYNDAATKPELSTEIELTLARRAIGVYPGAQARTNQVLQSRPEREETTPGVVSVQN